MAGDSNQPATVGVTADRRADEQALLLERLGLRVVLGPVLGTVMVTEGGPLRDVTASLISRPPDYVVANTGIGVRSWLAAAESWGQTDALLGALRHTRIAARGPKAVGALRSAGLDVWWRAPTEQLGTVIDHLLAEPLEGARIAVQLHGEDSPESVSALRAAGAEVLEIPVYRWTVPADDAPALRLIASVCEGRIDAVTFTSAPAVRNLLDLASGVGLAGDLLAALNGPVLVACVGPVCAGAAHEQGIVDVAVPEHWRLGALVRLVADELDRRAEASALSGR